jgi:hypothetical protein
MIAILGEAPLGDRLEKIAYNALRHFQRRHVVASIRPTAQPGASPGQRDWTTNRMNRTCSAWANFGCCAANFHQGWPVRRQPVDNDPRRRPGRGGLRSSRVVARVRGSVEVKVVETSIRSAIPSILVSLPARKFSSICIPGWRPRPGSLNGKPVAVMRAGAFHRLERRWSRATALELRCQ